jgi:hypothetical protein
MQLTERDERMFEFLRTVRMVELRDLPWALGGFAGTGQPVTLRKAQQWVARCRAVGLVATARPTYKAGGVVWGTWKITGRPAPSLLRQTARHDLAVAAVATRYICAGWDWGLDRDLEHGWHAADGVAIRSGRRELIEVELTTKVRERYTRIFRSHDERIRFGGINTVTYIANPTTAPAIATQIQQRIDSDIRDRFETITALDMWGRLTQEQWPTYTPRFTRPPEQLHAPADVPAPVAPRGALF